MGCEGCFHKESCGYLSDEGFGVMSEIELFEKHCVGCCCGDGAVCNKNSGDSCSNYEIEPIMG